MIVYHATKSEFLNAVFTRDIEAVILAAYRKRVGHGVSRQEVRSWKESLLAMAKVLNDDSIPSSCGVAVEYGIPQTSKRIDMLLSGHDEAGRANLLIVELKPWETAKRTNMDAVVRTRFEHGESDTNHPSYQSWSYAELLRNFNETVYLEDVPLQPCAYLHNCRDGGASFIVKSTGLPAGETANTGFLQVDPQRPSVLYLGTEGSGLFKSTDAAETWFPINLGLGGDTHYDMSISGLVMDPESPDTLYAATAYHSVYKTSTGGQ